MRRAVIDIGTNSVLLLIADISGDGRLSVIGDKAVITRLGEGFGSNRIISRPAFERTLSAVIDYLKLCEEKSVSDIFLVGTEVFRKAENAGFVLDSILRATGLPVKVLTGRQEAEFSFRSAIGDDCAPDSTYLVIDVGGGSSEFASGSRDALQYAGSIPIGCVSLTERILHHDPPLPEELETLKSVITDRLADLPDFSADTCAIGIGGTITTAAAVIKRMTSWDPDAIDGQSLYGEDLRELFETLTGLTTDERRTLPGMEPLRADVISAGVAVLYHVLRRFHLDSIRISVRGIRYGCIVNPV